LKKGCCARIQKEDVRTPALFHLMQKTGNISEHDMFNTFNMGVGMIAIVSKEEADKALQVLHEAGEDAYIIGEVQAGEKTIEIL
ncbi:MAG: AIR synthase-related protein, partial [Negativibacillus sp.]|nr:AIR synthase-related protein [Negativibacillus sp.]